MNDGIRKISFSGTIAFWHGSRHGLIGSPQHDYPNARETCDFGRGFYLNTSEEYAKCWICASENSQFYKVVVDTEKIRCIELSDMDWAMYIAINRGYVKAPIIKEYFDLVLFSYDAVYGKIADDRMNNVMRRFFNNEITTISFVKALEVIDLGNQLALKTENACNSIYSIENIFIDIAERERISKKNWEIKNKKFLITNEILEKHHFEGKFFSDIVGKMEEKVTLRTKILKENIRNLTPKNEQQIIGPKM